MDSGPVNTKKSRFFAHSAPEGGADEPLSEHLYAVAARTGKYAGAFGAATEGRMTGLLHDGGKASEIFTRRLRGEVSGLDHWSPGAALALRRYEQHGIAAALAIQGHHVGLGRASNDAIRDLYRLRAEGRTLTVQDPDLLLERLQAEGIALPDLSESLYDQRSPHAAGLLDIRMLFSALVDADFLETEAHFDRDEHGRRRYRTEAPELEPAKALELVEGEVERLAEQNRSRSSEEVQQLRSGLFRTCLEQADRSPGLFTLSAPTGSGKTLSMLAFALRHARRHGLRRVVIAIPYLSILEQTAGVYRDLLEPELGSGYVLEHHSLAGVRGEVPSEDEQGPSPAEVLRRRQAENWDAPLVVTTNVQLLESLFANGTRRCRKLHRLAQSVVLFDEVQTLPRWLAVATLAALSRLNERYGASIVFSTATQPAFDALDDRVRDWCAQGWQAHELVPTDTRLLRRLDRVNVEWRVGKWTREDRLPWDLLADELCEEDQVLCILNLKRHARDVARQLEERNVEGLFHLSTSMCPMHRRHVLEQVKESLATDAPCRLISTQCVEAGVDVDFPTVYRAFAPLDALAQAAGRCNRNGRREGKGRLVVFLPDENDDKAYPGGDYEQAADVTRELLMRRPMDEWDLEDTALYRTWYEKLYDLSGLGKGEQAKERELQQAMATRDFEETARRYRLIPNDTVQIVVPWDREKYEELKVSSRERPWISADWMRQAQVHTVSLARWKVDDYRGVLLEAPLGAHRPDQRSQEWFFLQDDEARIYDDDFGLGDPPVTLFG